MKKSSEQAFSIAILMATYNGEQYIAEQLDSIVNQTEQSFVLFVSDDGSTDATLDIVRRFQDQLGPDRIIIRDGPKQGYGRNFFSMLTEHSITADYFTFCDQDDIWEPDRLSRAVSKIKLLPTNQSALHICSAILIDHNGNFIGKGKRLPQRADLRSLLLQPAAGGNTMVFNRALANTVKQLGTNHEADNHDWLLCLINASIGGQFLFEPAPLIRYRQHLNNAMGPSFKIATKLKRLRMLMDGTFSGWLDNNLVSLRPYRTKMSSETLRDFDDFHRMRDHTSSVFMSQKLFTKFRRSNKLENLVLRALIFMKRI